MRYLSAFFASVFLSALLFAQDDEDFAPVPAPPDLPDPLESGQPLEPQVTIIRKEKALIEEYRLNGRLYMVKVTPDIGKAYFLIDRDGDGRMESRTNDIYQDPNVPQWVLFSW